ncbi:MAG: hypothetical protein ABW250_10250 [Pyrinomonadaceae bacterium]
MSADERVVGYDAREMWSGAGAAWDAARREAFLFRPGVEKPLSTDTIVWPSVFGLEGGAPRPAYTGYQDLWNSLSELELFLAGIESLKTRPYSIVAVTLPLPLRDPGELERWEFELGATSPSIHEEAWPLLGYDVADRWLLSGLSNCGFLPGVEDVKALRDEWSPGLNEFHLFEQISKASEFRDLSDERVREHAPFFVYGLRLIMRQHPGLGSQAREAVERRGTETESLRTENARGAGRSRS